METIRDASESVYRARRRHRLRRFYQLRLSNPIRLIDEMLGQLEELNLHGSRRVKLEWAPRLALLAANLPPPVQSDPAELRPGVSPSRLMEALFRIQDQLFDLKIGPLRRHLRHEDEIVDTEN